MAANKTMTMAHKKHIIIHAGLLLFFLCTATQTQAQNTELQYLSGTDKDHTVAWEFFCSQGMNSGKWTTIGVPSLWDVNGFGGQNYGHDKEPHNEKGFYRYAFSVSPQWRSKRVFIVFEGSMTDTEVRINGQLAGPVHQGSFYRFKYEISELLKFNAPNRLEVAVSKESANESVNRAERRADYWIFGGIFRPVYLEAQPQAFIERVALNAKHDGTFYMETYTHGVESANHSVEVQVQTLEGKNVGRPLTARQVEDNKYVATGTFDSPLTWTSETPHLYQAVVYLKDGKKLVHNYAQKFGFRTIELRKHDGFYVNGVKVKFKGVCRHTFWPESGRASSKALAIEDVNLIKEMNMNAVRMSHYPPDTYFLDVCDSLGLYVIDELAGWQKRYDTPTAFRLIKSMVTRDVNHPCIVIWANGNEGGFPQDARDQYALYDPQKRQVIEPWSLYDGVDTRHYPKYGYTEEALTQHDNVYMPTEFLHGLHDGGHGAGLEDYWNLMWKSPLSAGGFLWNLADEGVVRKDIRDSIDVKGNYAPDGILGPHHEKEGSFYAIKEIWSPIYVTAPVLNKAFDGKVAVENRYHFTDLNQCTFAYKLLQYTSFTDSRPGKVHSAALAAPQVAPGQSGYVDLNLPPDWARYDVLYLTATDRYGKEIYTWSWNLTKPQEMARRWVQGETKPISIQETANLLRVICGQTEITFNKQNGLLENVCHQLQHLSLGNGPRFVGIEPRFQALTHGPVPQGYQVSLTFTDGAVQKWLVRADGWVQLDYSYTLSGQYDYAGLSFSYPENQVEGARLMANGPYHVWKNRLKGVTFGLYDKTYNNTITGQTWEYPEFKGYYSHLYAVRILNSQLPFTVMTANEDMYLHLFTPQRPVYYSKNVDPRFPRGDISFLNAIPPIGTKFSRAEQEGPQGQQNSFDNETIHGTLYFKFGD